MLSHNSATKHKIIQQKLIQFPECKLTCESSRQLLSQIKTAESSFVGTKENFILTQTKKKTGSGIFTVWVDALKLNTFSENNYIFLMHFYT